MRESREKERRVQRDRGGERETVHRERGIGKCRLEKERGAIRWREGEERPVAVVSATKRSVGSSERGTQRMDRRKRGRVEGRRAKRGGQVRRGAKGSCKQSVQGRACERVEEEESSVMEAGLPAGCLSTCSPLYLTALASVSIAAFTDGSYRDRLVSLRGSPRSDATTGTTLLDSNRTRSLLVGGAGPSRGIGVCASRSGNVQGKQRVNGVEGG